MTHAELSIFPSGMVQSVSPARQAAGIMVSGIVSQEADGNQGRIWRISVHHQLRDD